VSETAADTAAHYVKGSGVVDKTAEATATHVLDGAFAGLNPDAVARAARFAAREQPDLAGVLGLEVPPRPQQVIAAFGCDVLADLLRVIGNEGDAAAREEVAAMAPVEREAARAELARRIAERPKERR
jgi:hypothetical protein